MFQITEPSTSKAAKLSTYNEDNDIEMELEECNNGNASLWCVDDDTMFYAQGLKHHSAGKGKSVYVTWNENYLLNFVFKTSSKTGITTLTKVRILMPLYEKELEEIANMLILEMNTLLYMKSGRVYYFSSIKSMHKVDWLTGVRCMASCPQTQFSVIHVDWCGREDNVEQRRIIYLKVYKDVPQLGKCINDHNVLRHSYNISFDVENIFNCGWFDENYTLLSLIADEKNIVFLGQLVSIGNIFRTDDEKVVLEINQEVHIFTISGNIFILVGAVVSECELQTQSPEVEDYSIRHLNTYASNIECVRIDCEKNILIVLLQSGHMDIWYKSDQMFGSIFRHQHQIPNFLDYDYRPLENAFYFTTMEDVVKLNVIMSSSTVKDKECSTKEIRKSINGMVACTWVENLQQLICLSFNNIFYKIYFTPLNETIENSNESETKYENLNHLYALNTKRVNDIMARAKIVNELMEQPKYLLEAIDREFEKQQIIMVGSKHEILKKLFQCNLEYHVYMPGIEYFEDCIQIKITRSSVGLHSIFCLIYLTLKQKKPFLTSIFKSSTWYLHISNQQQSLLLHIPYELLNNKICFIMENQLMHCECYSLSKFSISLLSFLSHNSNFICLRFNLILDTNEKTYQHIFSSNIQNVPISQNSLCDIENLLSKFNTTKSESIDICHNRYEFKHYFAISEKVLKDIISKLKAKTSLRLDFKLYYLYQYLIDMKYDEPKQILQICSKYPEAILYIKLFLMHAVHSFQDLDVCGNTNDIQKKIMNYQSDIENLYGSLVSLAPEDVNSNTFSIHLENMRKVYLNLRTEFY